MALKDILLHVDNSASFANRLDVAIDLAHSHDAHLKGLYVLSHSYYTPNHGSVTMDAIRAAEELFLERTSAAKISAEWLFVDWTVVGVSVTEIVNLHAYYTDLVIVGQPNHAAHDRQTPADLAERLGLGSGCPVLVVPYAGNFKQIGTRVMIAWKSGREAARATNDALPILEKAQSVSVITIGTATSFDSTGIDNAQKICSRLAHHGINAHHEQVLASNSLSVGDMLLNHACEHKMDLLVMGAYAQTRRGVYMHSPVARQMMNVMTVPILFSH